MPAKEHNPSSPLEAMVEQQLRSRGIRDQAVLKAFLATPREMFLPPERIHQAYEDGPVPIGYGQTISQPYVIALMLQELDVQPTDKVLDVGAGSGYQTALLAALARHVYALERLEQLTERATDTLARLGISNVTLATRDGSLGWPAEAPFDRIICGAAAREVPQPWIDQLADGGRIVMPIGGEHYQTLVVVQRRGEKLARRELCDVRFVKLIGRGDGAWPEG